VGGQRCLRKNVEEAKAHAFHDGAMGDFGHGQRLQRRKIGLGYGQILRHGGSFVGWEYLKEVFIDIDYQCQ
jgi:hypothetical protein